MTFETGEFSSDEITATAAALGYNYTDLTFDPTVGGRQTPQFEGRIGLQSLPSGISLCSSDLKSLHDSEHTGLAGRSLALALVLNGHGEGSTFYLDKPVTLGPNSASVISVADTTPITGRYTAGQRVRSLLIRTRPEDISDEAMAEQVESLLRSTSVSMMPVSRRIMSLAEEVATPSCHGVVGQLLAESCAFELLARAFSGFQEQAKALPSHLSYRDRARLQRVRDMIVANPEAHFTLDGLAREAGMSMTVLKTKFSALFGQSVFSFLRDVRLSYAKEGLENEGWSVSQAAHFVGYRHHSNFSTAFRRRYGVSPREFRRG